MLFKDCLSVHSDLHVPLFFFFLFFFFKQYFEHVEEAEWAVQVLKTTGKPVAATMCIGPEGDLNKISPGDCAVKLVRAGMTTELLYGPVLSVMYCSLWVKSST